MAESIAEDRKERGRAVFREVYGDLVPAPPPGAAPAFELLILEQQFAEVWSRPELSVPSRRLLTMGVIAANGEYETLEMQFRRAIQVGELSVEQVREVAIHLITYVGTTAAGGILRSSEAAIAGGAGDRDATAS